MPAPAASRVRLALEGTTVNDGVISGFVKPEEGTTLPGQDFRTTTFQLALAPGAPTSAATGSKLRIETDLDQVNPADGSATNLEYTDPVAVTVNAAPVPPPIVPPPFTIVIVPRAVTGCTVPTLVGTTYAQAKAKVTKAACPRLTIAKPSGKTPKGKKLVVVKASPKPGTALAGTRTVKITLGFKKK